MTTPRSTATNATIPWRSNIFSNILNYIAVHGWYTKILYLLMYYGNCEIVMFIISTYLLASQYPAKVNQIKSSA